MLLALLLAAMAMVPMVNAEESANASTGPVSMKDAVGIQDPENDTLGFLPVNRISIDESIEKATPYYVMLTGNDKEKQNLIGLLTNHLLLRLMKKNP